MRPHPTSALAAAALLAACATSSPPAPPPAPAAPARAPSAAPARPAAAPTPPPAPLIAPAELVALHDAVRVPGLERRDFNHATYWRVMQPFLGGSVSWKVEGQSAEGREIRHLTFGSGPIKVLLWSQMHGNESTASMALVDIVRFFHEQPDHPLAKRIASGATIHLIPMLNPDGAERFRRRNAQGIDVNRDARRLQTPEGKLLKRVSDELKPDFGFNLHDQSPGTRVGRTNRGAAIALLAPAFNEARDVDAKRERAMRVASVVATSMRPLVTDHITKYDDAFNPRAFGDLMRAWGASTVLIESGGWADDPQKQYLRKTNFVGILSALDAIATGTYAQYDPAIYDTLEPNGRSMPDLLVVNGTLALPGIPTLTVDLLISYALPLEKAEGTITDIGDLGDVQAQDTLDLTGLYIIPLPEALDGKGGIDAGAPARFIVAEDAQGTRVRFRFEGGPPKR